jgi:hypothetical protein
MCERVVMNKRLTDEQIAFYHQQGYLHARGIVPPDVLQLAHIILERWMNQTIDRWVQQGLTNNPQTEVGFAHRLVRVWNAASRPHYIRSPRRDLVSLEMFHFLAHPALVDVAEDLLGTPEVSAHGIFNARPKLPDQRWTDTPWHQDAQYYKDAADIHVVYVDAAATRKRAQQLSANRPGHASWTTVRRLRGRDRLHRAITGRSQEFEGHLD